MPTNTKINKADVNPKTTKLELNCFLQNKIATISINKIKKFSIPLIKSRGFLDENKKGLNMA